MIKITGFSIALFFIYLLPINIGNWPSMRFYFKHYFTIKLWTKNKNDILVKNSQITWNEHKSLRWVPKTNIQTRFEPILIILEWFTELGNSEFVNISYTFPIAL